MLDRERKTRGVTSLLNVGEDIAQGRLLNCERSGVQLHVDAAAIVSDRRLLFLDFAIVELFPNPIHAALDSRSIQQHPSQVDVLESVLIPLQAIYIV